MLFSFLFAAVYFIVLAMYIVHNENYPPLEIAFIALVALLIILPIIFFLRYNHLAKKILNFHWKVGNSLKLSFIRYKQYEVLAWIIIINLICLILFIISNIIAASAESDNFFTIYFMLTFFFASFVEWAVITMNVRGNSTVFSVIFLFFEYTYEKENELIKSSNDFTILCQYAGFKYKYLEKIMNATYWISNFVWIYIISDLVGTSFTVESLNADLTSVIDLVCYLGPYLFLYYINMTIHSEKDNLSALKILNIKAETNDYFFRWLVNVKKYFLKNSVFYKRENISYWSFRDFDPSNYKNSYQLYSLYKIYSFNFTYYGDLSIGNVDSLSITDISNEFTNTLTASNEILDFKQLREQKVIFFFYLSWFRAFFFYSSISKKLMVSNKKQLWKNLFFSIKPKIYMSFDADTKEFKIIPHNKLKFTNSSEYKEIWFFNKNALRYLFSVYYETAIQHCINPMISKTKNSVTSQAYICPIKSYSDFFSKILGN